MFNARLVLVTLMATLTAAGCGSEKKSEPSASALPSSATPSVVPALDAQTVPAPTPATAAAVPEPSPAQIDALVAIAEADGYKAMEPQSDLWTALFQLKQWHLMTFPDSKSVPPGLNIETHDGKLWVMVFTDQDRLHEYAKARKQLNADGTMLGMSIPSQTSFEFFESLQGIAGVRFNQGESGFFSPMDNLRPIHDHLVKLGRL